MERLGVTASREEVVEELVRQFRRQFAVQLVEEMTHG